VEPDLSLPGDPEGFVVGDQTHEIGEPGSSLPAVAPVAMQQGVYPDKTDARDHLNRSS